MTKIGKINARLTESARAEMLEFLSKTNDKDALLGIFKWRSSGETEERFGYGSYLPEQIQKVTPEYEQQGYAFLYDLDGITVVLSQFHLLDELDEKLADVSNGTLIIRDE